MQWSVFDLLAWIEPVLSSIHTSDDPTAIFPTTGFVYLLRSFVHLPVAAAFLVARLRRPLPTKKALEFAPRTRVVVIRALRFCRTFRRRIATGLDDHFPFVVSSASGTVST